jgi:hypothetical protein
MVIAAAACAAATLSTASTATGHPVHDGSGKEAGFDRVAEPVSPGGVPQERLSSIKCTDDKAGIFPCHRVDLASFVPLSELGGSIWANDVWGWTDPQTGRDYALAKLFEGTAFVDVTDETDPVYLGTLPSPAPNPDDNGHIWGDIKTYGNHAFIGSEAAGHGVQIFDLTRLRGVTEEREWTQDGQIADFGQSHNIALNEDSATLYVIGAWKGVTAPGCADVDGGPIMYDVSNPAEPQFVGCYGGDGYTHDIHCVDYHGPDAAYRGQEICVASNEDTVTVLDVTDKSDVKMLARAFVMRMTVFFDSSQMRPISSWSVARVSASSALSGSSSRRICGSMASARATDTRWRMPPESSEGRLSRAGVRFTKAMCRSTCCCFFAGAQLGKTWSTAR